MSFFYSSPADAILDAILSNDAETASQFWSDATGELEDFLATQTFVNLLGTLDGAGALTLAHNVDLTGASVIIAQAFYDDGAGGSVPLAVSKVDATNVVLAGGGAAAACRVCLVVGVGFVSF